MRGGCMRIVHYARVSSDAQAEGGYSVDGQLAELLQHSEREGHEVVAEVVDTGEKRWTLDRKGIRELRELVASEDVDEVWAWRWDRFGESPWPEVLAIELEEYGVMLRSLDDGGLGEDADILRVLRGALAKKEQSTRVARSLMGKVSKARRGEVLGAALQPRYGFEYVRNEKGKAVGYTVDPEKMEHVVLIFSMLAEGKSLHEVSRQLEQSGVPAPRGGPQWSRTTIRRIALEDVYRPHDHEELRAMVSADVFVDLDPGKPYGVSWFGRHKTRNKAGRGKGRKVELAPRENWIAVPVDLSGSGLGRETVDRAREAVSNNPATSKVGDRFWELSGVLYCGECGRAMIAYRRARQKGYYYYYRCRPSSMLANCPNRKSHRAEELEHDATVTFERYASRGTLLELYDQAVEEQENRIGLRGSLERRAALGERLEVLAKMRRGFQEQQAEGLMSIAELRERLEEIEEERDQVITDLRATEEATTLTRQIQAARESLLAADWFEVPEATQPWEWLSLTAKPEEIRRAYRRFGARFEVSAKGELTLRLKLDLNTGSLHSERTSS